MYAIRKPGSICLPSALEGETLEQAIADAKARGLTGEITLLNPPALAVHPSHVNAHNTGWLRFNAPRVYAVIKEGEA